MILKIRGFKAEAMLGVYSWEQTAPRPVIINMTVHYNPGASTASDNIADTLDYGWIERKTLDLLSGAHFNLLEKMVKTLGTTLMENRRIKKLVLEIDKPAAIASAESVAIVAEFEREEALV